MLSLHVVGTRTSYNFGNFRWIHAFNRFDNPSFSKLSIYIDSGWPKLTPFANSCISMEISSLFLEDKKAILIQNPIRETYLKSKYFLTVIFENRFFSSAAVVSFSIPEIWNLVCRGTSTFSTSHLWLDQFFSQ